MWMLDIVRQPIKGERQSVQGDGMVFGTVFGPQVVFVDPDLILKEHVYSQPVLSLHIDLHSVEALAIVSRNMSDLIRISSTPVTGAQLH